MTPTHTMTTMVPQIFEEHSSEARRVSGLLPVVMGILHIGLSEVYAWMGLYDVFLLGHLLGHGLRLRGLLPSIPDVTMYLLGTFHLLLWQGSKVMSCMLLGTVISWKDYAFRDWVIGVCFLFCTSNVLLQGSASPSALRAYGR